MNIRKLRQETLDHLAIITVELPRPIIWGTGLTLAEALEEFNEGLKNRGFSLGGYEIVIVIGSKGKLTPTIVLDEKLTFLEVPCSKLFCEWDHNQMLNDGEWIYLPKSGLHLYELEPL